jgi:hypothetical protein
MPRRRVPKQAAVRAAKRLTWWFPMLKPSAATDNPPAAGRQTDWLWRQATKHRLPRSAAAHHFAERSKHPVSDFGVARSRDIWCCGALKASLTLGRSIAACSLASLGAVWFTPKVLPLLEHCTASFVLPNVRAEAPVEAGSVSLD